MKKFIALSLLSFSFATAEVVSIFDINEQTLTELTQGHHPDLAIQFPEKTQLPISFFVKGDLVELVENPITQLEVKKTFYMKKTDGHLFFSTDLAEWKRFAHFATGTTTFSVDIENGVPMVRVGSVTNQR